MKQIIFVTALLCGLNIGTIDAQDCTGLTHGFYQYGERGIDYLDKGIDSTIIYRDAEAQIEYNKYTDAFAFMKLDWNSECVYTLKVLNYNTQRNYIRIGLELRIEILSTQENGFTFGIKKEGLNEFIPGRIILVEQKVEKSVLRKIKKTFKQNKRKYL